VRPDSIVFVVRGRRPIGAGFHAREYSSLSFYWPFGKQWNVIPNDRRAQVTRIGCGNRFISSLYF
jgi:hypothetical protein